MRFDAVGIFWEDRPAARKGDRSIGPMPPIPDTGWKVPTEYPNLTGADVIGFDVETYDPELRQAGPGWGRGKGHIVGISLAVPGRGWYFPIRHETQPELNLDAEQTLRYVAAMLGDRRQPKVGANLIYDFGWLLQEGVRVEGPLYDVQFAEALLNSEAPDVSLENLAEHYLGAGKVTSILYDWLATWLGGAANDRQRGNIYRAPVTLAGPYAEADAFLPIAILEKQWPAMALRGVLELFHLECRLIPLLVAMRMKGAPTNIGKAEEVHERLGKEADLIAEELKHIAGQPVNPAASDSIKSAFIKLGIPIPEKLDKKKGIKKQTFAADVLEDIDHPLAIKIVEHRKLLKVRNTFIGSYILEKNINGRVHCSFNPLKGDNGGTRSGRFSSSDPNLQNIPVRTELGALVREIFEAKYGKWRKWDYSQIEYRLLAHHAVGAGAEELRANYRENPDIDYHELIGDLIKTLTGIELPRRNIKTINFGLIYGMSQPELARRLGLDRRGSTELFDQYHTAAPFARETMKAAEAEIHRYGYVTTLLGRKSDFPLWGPIEYDNRAVGLPYERAISTYGAQIKRSYTHKGLNRKLQGGAADIMKKAMLDAYEAGLFADDACGIPILTVHDELDFEDESAPDNPAWAELRHVMENCVQTLVPIKVDDGIGPNWRMAD